MSAPTLLLATCRELPDGDPDTVLLASHLRRLPFCEDAVAALTRALTSRLTT